MSTTAADHPVLGALLSTNAQWSHHVSQAEPTFFDTCAQGQSPKVLWIGCADSRVPESVITASKPGEIFVHRNIANQFHHNDDSAQSVLAYALDVLGVEHVVVVGHTGCGGAAACYDNAKKLLLPTNGDAQRPAGTPLERWLTPLTRLAASLPAVASLPPAEALPLLVEANVKAQVENIVRTDTIARAWQAGKPVHVHGWVYTLEQGRLKDLCVSRGPTA